MRLLLIANPVAGKKAPRLIERARRALACRCDEVELFLTGKAGDARRRALEARHGSFDRVIVAGGDGTLNEVVNGLSGSSLPVGLVPLGTTNVFALEAGIPFDIERAARIACEEQPRPVTLGRAGEHFFLLMAGAGFDGQVVKHVSPATKRRLGKGAYLLTALKQWLFHPPACFEIECDGIPLRVAGALLANARSYAGSWTLTPEADLETGSLELCLLEKPGRLSLLGQTLCLILGRPIPRALGRVVTVSTLKITAPGIPVQVDGDYLADTPLDFACEPGALQLIYPRDVSRGDAP